MTAVPGQNSATGYGMTSRPIAWAGRIIIIGFASGRVPQVPANIALVKNIDIIGFFWGSYQARKPELVRQSYAQLFRWFEEGKLKPRVSHRLDLQDVAQAMNLLRPRGICQLDVTRIGHGQLPTTLHPALMRARETEMKAYVCARHITHSLAEAIGVLSAAQAQYFARLGAGAGRLQMVRPLETG